MNNFGEKLHTLRKRQGLSLKQLGDILGVSKTYVWEMEKGEKIPNVAMLVKIADVFQVSLDRLARDELALED